MASIGSLSSSTSSLVSGGNGLHGYGGLASGLDRDTLIESMTYATRVKIAKKQQKKQSLEWKQTAYRSVTDKLVALSSKYMDYTNPTSNLSSSALFAKTNITAYGKNSSKVSVTSAGSNSADSLTILGVKQMAKNASYTTAAASDKTLETGAINSGTQYVSSLKGETFSVEYAGHTYTVQFAGLSTDSTQGGKSEDAMQDLINKMQASLKDVKLEGEEGKTLADVISIGKSGAGERTALEIKNNSSDTIKLTASSETVRDAMGIDEDGLNMGAGTSFDQILKSSLLKETTFEERITGQSLTFTYNGQSADIRISKEDLEAAKTANSGDIMAAVKDVLQKGLNKAFGEGRVEAGLNTAGDGFTFKATRPGGGDDDTSILTLSYGSTGMLGEDGAFNVNGGESNRVNLNVGIGSGLTGLANNIDTDDLSMKINGVDITGITENSTINEIINAINRSDAGVTVSYLQNSDKFVISSTVDGASGKVKWEGALADSLFGAYNKDAVQEGQDAIVTVQYAGSSETVDLYRGTNNFTQDGLNISIKGEFGYEKDADGKATKLIEGEEVTFESKANVDNVLSSIKDMVNAYNEIVDLVNGFLTTKPNRDYQPLSDEQKEEMTEDQIEKWEKKAKEGILFGDDLLRSLSSDLRFVTMGSLMSQLESIGISEVSDYTANGKLTIDENKLKNALETDPDKVAKLFTSTDKSQPGLMTNLKKITDSYAKTLGSPKGSLIQRAGSESSALSLTDNEIYKELKDIDDLISQLQTRLKSEQDRYISQFTRLETVIAQMNSQSSYLSSMSGGY